MPETKYYNGNVVIKVTEQMVGKGLARISRFSLLPEFKRDADGKLEKNAENKAMVDDSKPIITFEGEGDTLKARCRIKVNMTKGSIKTCFDEEVSEKKDIYLSATAFGYTAQGLKNAFEKGKLTKDTALSMVIQCEKNDSFYNATILSWEYDNSKKSEYHVVWSRKLTEKSVGQIIASFKKMTMMPSFKKDADGNTEKDADGKSIIDTTIPVFNYEGDVSNLNSYRGKFKTGVSIPEKAIKFMFDEDVPDEKIYLYATTYGYTTDGLVKLNTKNPIDNQMKFRMDMIVSKNGDFHNGIVIGWELNGDRKKEGEETSTPTSTSNDSIGADIMSAMNAPTSSDTVPNIPDSWL